MYKMFSFTKSVRALVAAFTLVTLPAWAVDISGTWAWTIETPDGNTFKSVMTAKQAEAKLTGHLTSPNSENKLTLEKGSVKKDQVSFTVRPNFNGNEITVEYSGKVKDNKIDGKLVVVEFAAELEWHAKRVEKSVDPSGTWDWTLQTPNGNEIGATLEIEWKNNKLSGEIIADSWTVEIEKGKVEGNAIQFTTSNPENGQTYVSKGKIKGKSMSGTVSFTSDAGDDVTLDWAATRD